MVNQEFSIPYYIFQEIIDYIELTSEGRNKTAKWENIKALIKLAVLNSHITESQAEFLIKTYSRENLIKK